MPFYNYIKTIYIYILKIQLEFIFLNDLWYKNKCSIKGDFNQMNI